VLLRAVNLRMIYHFKLSPQTSERSYPRPARRDSPNPGTAPLIPKPASSLGGQNSLLTPSERKHGSTYQWAFSGPQNASEWNFHKDADVQQSEAREHRPNWKPEGWGKGIVFRDGSVHTWNTGSEHPLYGSAHESDGFPFHADYIINELNNNPPAKPEQFFAIEPSGATTASELYMPFINEAHPELTPGGSRFGKTADAHEFPQYNHGDDYDYHHWTPGNLGKGFIAPDGRLVTWNVGGHADRANSPAQVFRGMGPHHREVAEHIGLPAWPESADHVKEEDRQMSRDEGLEHEEEEPSWHTPISIDKDGGYQVLNWNDNFRKDKYHDEFMDGGLEPNEDHDDWHFGAYEDLDDDRTSRGKWAWGWKFADIQDQAQELSKTQVVHHALEDGMHTVPGQAHNGGEAVLWHKPTNSLHIGPPGAHHVDLMMSAGLPHAEPINNYFTGRVGADGRVFWYDNFREHEAVAAVAGLGSHAASSPDKMIDEYDKAMDPNFRFASVDMSNPTTPEGAKPFNPNGTNKGYHDKANNIFYAWEFDASNPNVESSDPHHDDIMMKLRGLTPDQVTDDDWADCYAYEPERGWYNTREEYNAGKPIADWRFGSKNINFVEHTDGWVDEDENEWINNRVPFLFDPKTNTVHMGQKSTHHGDLYRAVGVDWDMNTLHEGMVNTKPGIGEPNIEWWNAPPDKATIEHEVFTKYPHYKWAEEQPQQEGENDEWKFGGIRDVLGLPSRNIEQPTPWVGKSCAFHDDRPAVTGWGFAFLCEDCAQRDERVHGVQLERTQPDSASKLASASTTLRSFLSSLRKSAQVDIQPWEPGRKGKAMCWGHDPSDTFIWATDDEGNPHHYDVCKEVQKFNFIALEIEPDGGVYVLFGDPSCADLVVQRDPRLHNANHKNPALHFGGLTELDEHDTMTHGIGGRVASEDEVEGYKWAWHNGKGIIKPFDRNKGLYIYHDQLEHQLGPGAGNCENIGTMDNMGVVNSWRTKHAIDPDIMEWLRQTDPGAVFEKGYESGWNFAKVAWQGFHAPNDPLMRDVPNPSGSSWEWQQHSDRYVKCPNCKGTGYEDDGITPCLVCDESGHITRTASAPEGRHTWIEVGDERFYGHPNQYTFHAEIAKMHNLSNEQLAQAAFGYTDNNGFQKYVAQTPRDVKNRVGQEPELWDEYGPEGWHFGSKGLLINRPTHQSKPSPHARSASTPLPRPVIVFNGKHHIGNPGENHVPFADRLGLELEETDREGLLWPSGHMEWYDLNESAQSEWRFGSHTAMQCDGAIIGNDMRVPGQGDRLDAVRPLRNSLFCGRYDRGPQNQKMESSVSLLGDLHRGPMDDTNWKLPEIEGATPWRPGIFGKGAVTSDGNIYAWGGQDIHHDHVLDRHEPEPQHYDGCFFIGKDGTVSGAEETADDDLMQRAVDSDPRFKKSESGWKFGNRGPTTHQAAMVARKGIRLHDGTEHWWEPGLDTLTHVDYLMNNGIEPEAVADYMHENDDGERENLRQYYGDFWDKEYARRNPWRFSNRGPTLDRTADWEFKKYDTEPSPDEFELGQRFVVDTDGKWYTGRGHHHQLIGHFNIPQDRVKTMGLRNYNKEPAEFIFLSDGELEMRNNWTFGSAGPLSDNNRVASVPADQIAVPLPDLDPWRPGSYGKGFFLDDEIYAWNVGVTPDGRPFHNDVLEELGREAFEVPPEEAFYINTNGVMMDPYGSYIKGYGTVPIHMRERSDWKFGASQPPFRLHYLVGKEDGSVGEAHPDTFEFTNDHSLIWNPELNVMMTGDSSIHHRNLYELVHDIPEYRASDAWQAAAAYDGQWQAYDNPEDERWAPAKNWFNEHHKEMFGIPLDEHTDQGMGYFGAMSKDSTGRITLQGETRNFGPLLYFPQTGNVYCQGVVMHRDYQEQERLAPEDRGMTGFAYKGYVAGKLDWLGLRQPPPEVSQQIAEALGVTYEEKDAWQFA
jgi:hypothetical protein